MKLFFLLIGRSGLGLESAGAHRSSWYDTVVCSSPAISTPYDTLSAYRTSSRATVIISCASSVPLSACICTGAACVPP